MSTSKAAQRKSPRKAKQPVEERPAFDRFVVFLRHGIAEERTAEKPDEDRGLTAEGHARMKQIARGLERALPKVQTIYASPLLRAVQTALWVSKGYRSRANVKTVDELTPAASVEDLVSMVMNVKERRIIVVGHEPNLSEAVRSLLNLPASQPMDLKKGGCFGLLIHPDGTATLEWALPPRILRKLGEG
jgi:phosphohistidine phosphatase